MFSLISARINGWVNNRDAGDLRRIRPHYVVTVMQIQLPFSEMNDEIWGSFPQHGLSSILACVIPCPVKCRMKLLIHSQTSTAAPLTFGNRYVISPPLYHRCNYLSMLWLKSILVGKREIDILTFSGRGPRNKPVPLFLRYNSIWHVTNCCRVYLLFAWSFLFIIPKVEIDERQIYKQASTGFPFTYRYWKRNWKFRYMK